MTVIGMMEIFISLLMVVVWDEYLAGIYFLMFGLGVLILEKLDS